MIDEPIGLGTTTLDFLTHVLKEKNKERRLPVLTPSWDEYFLTIAAAVALKSPDAQTKVGSLITQNNRIIGTGFNGHPAGTDDEVWANIRPFKYECGTIHAEENCIANLTQVVNRSIAATLYCTLRPCFKCLCLVSNAGVTRIVVKDTEPSKKTSEFGEEFLYLLMKKNIEYLVK